MSVYKRLINEGLEEPLIEKEEKGYKINQGKSIMFAILTGTFYALHNFTLGSLAELGYLARFNTGVGMVVSAIIYYLFQYLRCLKNGERFFKPEKSIFRNHSLDIGEEQTEEFEPRVVLKISLIILINQIIKIGGGVVVIFAFKLAYETGMNQGIITSIFGMTPFLASILFYFFFQEKLKISQFIGMIFMAGCIFCIALGSGKSSHLEPEESEFSFTENKSKALLCLLLACLCPIFFAAGGLLMKLLRNEFHTDPTEFTQVCYLLQIPILGAGIVYGYTYGGYKFILTDFLQMVAAGMLVNVGGACFNIAISYGNAGVAYSLINVQVIIFAILAAVFLHQIPTSIEILAGCLGIIGSCIMSLGPHFMKKANS